MVGDGERRISRGGFSGGIRNLAYDPAARGIALQILLVLAIAAIGLEIVSNAVSNLARQGITSGFGFLNHTSGFDISQKLIAYANTSTYARAFWVGLLYDDASLDASETLVADWTFAEVQAMRDAAPAEALDTPVRSGSPLTAARVAVTESGSELPSATTSASASPRRRS